MIAALALLAAGCSDEEVTPTDPSTSTTSTAVDTAADVAEIRATIATLATENEPGLCEEALTQRYLDENFPPAGPGALEDCQFSQRPEYKLEADSISFESVDVTGETATATFAISGGQGDGTVATIELAQSGDGVWQLDRTVQLEIVDRERVDAALLAVATNGPGALTAAEATCVLLDASSLSDETLERRAVRGSTFLPVKITIPCIGDGTPVGAAAEIARRSLASDPDFKPLAACVARRIAGELTEDDAIAFFAAEDRTTLELLRNQAIDACAGARRTGRRQLA